MNTFKRKSLFAALAGASVLGAAGSAHAVYINGDNLGQVLLYPYFTVRNSPSGSEYNTLLSVTNTTASVKAVKVRFLEGRNSREVLDFNLFLSPSDVWTAALVRTSDGAQIVSKDVSCMVGGSSASYLGNGVAFVNNAYAGANNDTGGADLDRAREGYFEVIEMSTYSAGSTTARAATHTNGVASCTTITDAIALAESLPPTGGLAGSAVLINVKEGTDYTMDPVALDGFFDVSSGAAVITRPTSGLGSIPGGGLRTHLYELSGSIYPNLGDVWPKVSTTDASNGTTQRTIVAAWDVNKTINLNASTPVGNPDPVSAVLMRNSVVNEWVVDSAIGAGTDWVVTMPTKFFYVVGQTSTSRLPFENAFSGGASCDEVQIGLWDREEQTIQASLPIFSPPSAIPVVSFCHEVNVFTFNKSNVFGSKLGVVDSSGNYSSLSVDQLPGAKTAGWARATFPTGSTGSTLSKHYMRTPGSPVVATFNQSGLVTLTQPTSMTFVGLPVIGFAVQRYVAPTGTVTGNYGGNFTHKFTRSIF